jgi:hypothetical protein
VAVVPPKRDNSSRKRPRQRERRECDLERREDELGYIHRGRLCDAGRSSEPHARDYRTLAGVRADGETARMDLAQVYETTIYDRESGQAVAFATVPARSLPQAETPAVEYVARAFDLRPLEGTRARMARIEPVEPWSLPFLLDALLGRFPPFPYYFDPLEPDRPRRGPSPLAQYLAYERVIPFESSPLGAASLASLVTATSTAGAALGYHATGDPILFLTVPAGIVVAGAALGIGAGTAIGLAEGVRHGLRRLMSLPDDEPPAEE